LDFGLPDLELPGFDAPEADGRRLLRFGEFMGNFLQRYG
jgi:hypothetical protein